MKKIIVLLLIMILFLSACTNSNSKDYLSSEVMIQETYSEIIKEESPQSATPEVSSVQPTTDEPPQQTTTEVSSTQEDVTSSIVSRPPIPSSEQEILYEEKVYDREIFSKISDKSYLELITKTYTEKQVLDANFLLCSYNSFAGWNKAMRDIVETYGFEIECVRKTGDNDFYCILKTEENGLVYCFFRDSDYSVAPLYNCAYLKESLKKSDFDGLKVGDSVEEVVKIDSAFASIYNHYNNGNWSRTWTHLLEDGILRIEYENSSIKSIEFDDDFVYGSGNTPYSYKILKQDYPQ